MLFLGLSFLATSNSQISNQSDFSFEIAIKYGGSAISTEVPDRPRLSYGFMMNLSYFAD